MHWTILYSTRLHEKELNAPMRELWRVSHTHILFYLPAWKSLRGQRGKDKRKGASCFCLMIWNLYISQQKSISCMKPSPSCICFSLFFRASLCSQLVWDITMCIAAPKIMIGNQIVVFLAWCLVFGGGRYPIPSRGFWRRTVDHPIPSFSPGTPGLPRGTGAVAGRGGNWAAS